MTLDHIVVVGASLAGVSAAEGLRRNGFEGRVTLLGAEDALPYDRPPLSKQLLTGEWEDERTELRPAADYEKHDIDLVLGRPVVDLDRAGRRVLLHGGDAVSFDGLIIATGSQARHLPGLPALDGIHVLRTLADARAIREELASARHLVVIGAGFIGAEVASSARGLGLEVTILEALPIPLARGLGEEMGQRCADLHRDNGTDLRLGVSVAGFTGTTHVEGVQLADGTTLEADLVLVGVGAAPTTGWLGSSGLTLDDGVVCDEFCRAVDTDDDLPIYAAGDVARWAHPRYQPTVRIEHWSNALEMGEAAASNLLASASGREPTAFAPVPYFWSDQYGIKIQFLGRIAPGDRVEIVDQQDTHKFAAYYERDGRLVAALGFGMPKAVMRTRRLLAVDTPFDEAVATLKR